MKVGILLPIADDDWTVGTPTYTEIRAIAVGAETAGLDSVWVNDHLLFRLDGQTTGIHECWTILTAIAEATSRVELGTIVLATEFRNPALLAKMAVALDEISEGRLILGLGAGWHDPEYVAFGYPTDRKVSRFEESLAIIAELLRTGKAEHAGTYHSASDCVLLPPARRAIPILIGAEGPRMLALTAQHADAWNLAWFATPDDRFATARAALAAACDGIGRDPGSIEITAGINVRYPDLLVGTAAAEWTGTALLGGHDEIAEALAAYAELGTGHVIAALTPTTPEALARFAEAVAAFRA